jgi:tetratricopeptide (TPR) repeat protein
VNTDERALRTQWGVLALLLVLAAAPFWAARDGGFVYDDRSQILENHLLAADTPWSEALSRDVWAFRAESDQARASNYWRPTFIAWLRAHNAAFGMSEARAWHLSVLGLHALAVLLAFAVARGLGLSAWPAGFVAALFAAHPTRVESVAWISGATDPLLAVFIFGATLAWLRTRAAGANTWAWWVLALSVYALALGTKEAALMWLPCLALLAAQRDGWVRCWRSVLPFVVLAAAFWLLRSRMLHGAPVTPPESLSVWEQIINLPRVAGFYALQCAWPWPLAPQYPLRAVHAADAPRLVVAIQLFVLIVGVLVALWYARRKPLVQLGMVWALAFLAPAFAIANFPFDQIVHDRYGYLPLFGVGLALVALWQAQPRRVQMPLAALGAGALLTCAVLSARYVPIWHSDERLWAHTVTVDPNSASAWANLAELRQSAGSHAGAYEAAQRALAIAPVTSAYLVRGDARAAGGDAAGAAEDYRAVLRNFPEFRPAVERLAALYQATGQSAQAEALLTDFITRAPRYRCGALVNLGILRYGLGDRAGAQARLDEAAQASADDASGACQIVHFYRAQLRYEAGDMAGARASLQEFFARTEGLADRSTARLRPAAQQLAQALSAAQP